MNATPSATTDERTGDERDPIVPVPADVPGDRLSDIEPPTHGPNSERETVTDTSEEDPHEAGRGYD